MCPPECTSVCTPAQFPAYTPRYILYLDVHPADCAGVHADVFLGVYSGDCAGVHAGVGAELYLSSVEDSDLDNTAWFLLIIQDAIGSKAPVSIVIKLNSARQAIRVL